MSRYQSYDDGEVNPFAVSFIRARDSSILDLPLVLLISLDPFQFLGSIDVWITSFG